MSTYLRYVEVRMCVAFLRKHISCLLIKILKNANVASSIANQLTQVLVSLDLQFQDETLYFISICEYLLKCGRKRTGIKIYYKFCLSASIIYI